MTILNLIELLENKVKHYQNQISIHAQSGDIETMTRFQGFLDETISTINKLKTLLNG